MIDFYTTIRNYLNMTPEQKIKQQQDRLKKVKAWTARIEKLRKRKKNAMSEAQFCRKYGIHPSGFNRNKKGVSFPTQKTVDRIEEALKSEGV